MQDKNIQTIKVFTFKESGKYYDEFEISVAPEEDNWYETIKAVREYKKTEPYQSSLDWLIGLDQETSKLSSNVANTIYPIILKG